VTGIGPALLPWLVTLPVVGAVVLPPLTARAPQRANALALAVACATSLIALLLVRELLTVGPFEAALAGWTAPYGIALRFDRFAAWTLPVCLLVTLVLVFARPYLVGTVARERWPALHALLLLNLAGLLGFSVTGDLFNLFVAMEVVSISSYALVAVAGRGVAAWAALKYLFLGAVSSLLVLLGVGLLFALTGSLDLVDVAARLHAQGATPAATTALASLSVAFLVKAALFPLHVWLPDAHAIAPSPVSAVLSGLVVKIGIVGLLRVSELAAAAGIGVVGVQQLLALLGAIAIVMGAFLAIFQDDIKLMLAYSTISNIGYIVLGIGLGSPLALIGAFVHVFNHALIKVTLFLAAGAIIHQTGVRTLSDLRGVARRMPLSAAAMAIGAVSIVGLPPTAGFVCKWYIALGAFEADQPLYGFALVFGALFIFVYYVRMLNAFYFQPSVHPHVIAATDPPLRMRAPLLTLAAACLLLGVMAGVPLAFIEPAVVELLAAMRP